MLSRVKLIAEPWDIGPDGYQVGNFPPGWAEWNDRYRDDGARATGTATSGMLPELRRAACSARPTCSSSAAAGRGRASTSSPPTTASRWPISSPTTTSTTRRTARTTATATTTIAAGTAASKGRPTIRPSSTCATACGATCIATLLLSQGTPMLLMGDEIGRTPGRQQQRLLPGQRDRLAGLERHRRPRPRLHGVRARR